MRELCSAVHSAMGQERTPAGTMGRVQDTLADLVARYDDAAPLDQAWTIPGAWYTDPRIEALERRTVWSRTWQVVGRAAQVAEPGQFLTAPTGSSAGSSTCAATTPPPS
jgi:hypothetical protein